MIDLVATLLPALAPVFIDGIKGLIGKIFGTVKPVSVDDQVKLYEAEARKLDALAKLDSIMGQTPSTWVIDLRASCRYITVMLIIFSTIIMAFTKVDKAIMEVMFQLSGSSLFFLIGDRVYVNLKKG